jgi:flagellar biosynthesis protein FlhB
MADKTEAPTAKKLENARKEGQVARSQELNAAAALFVGFWLLKNPGSTLVIATQQLVVNAIRTLPNITEINQAWLQHLLLADGMRVIPGFGLIVLPLMVTGVVVTFTQTNFLITAKRLGIDFNRLNPLNGFKRLLSPNSLVELIKALFKLIVIGWTAYSFLKSQVTNLASLSQMDLASGIQSWLELAFSLASRVTAIYLVLAISDYAYQRWQLNKTLKMSKEEIKEEYKTSEGDPRLRNRIRSQQRRFARMRMMSNVPKADVIITNPTHLAVAIQYVPKEMHAPKVLAKGADQMAFRIAEIGRANNIPIMQNKPLARALFKSVEIDQEIPPELYMAMAEVLAYIFKLHNPASRPNYSQP